MEAEGKVAKSYATPRTAVALGCLIPGKQDRYTCICCRVKFESLEQQRCHFKTEWHLYNLKRKVCNLEPINPDDFLQIQAANRFTDLDETSTLFSSYVDLGATNDQDDSAEQIDEDEWEKIEFLDEDYTSDEVDDMLSRKIESDTCLFCDFKSSDIKGNIDHMNMSHGFFLPEEQFLIDFEGMMDYLGFKVGAGATCLWCGKQFTSLHGVRLHMLYKNHCKILYDQEKAAEFKEYYDYTDQEQFPMKHLNQLVIDHPKPCHKRCSALPRERTLTGKEPRISRQQQIVKMGGSSISNDPLSLRSIKKFSAERAKKLLKTEVANNKTIRDRFRSQNPI